MGKKLKKQGNQFGVYPDDNQLGEQSTALQHPHLTHPSKPNAEPRGWAVSLIPKGNKGLFPPLRYRIEWAPHVSGNAE